VFDAHEYFEEVPEVQGRRFVQAFWRGVARIFLPFYHHAYTVGPALAQLFSRNYSLPFTVVRNVPVRREGVVQPSHDRQPRILLYQGALNAGRGIEAALEAMTRLEGVQLWLAGEGDLSDALRKRALELGLNENKVRFLGFVKPAELKNITDQAWLGLNLLENKGLSYYYSLANKFFDYVQARVPVLTMDFPEYRALNDKHAVAVLLPELTPEGIAGAVQTLLDDPETYRRLQEAEEAASHEWVWENDKQVLLSVWATVGKTYPWRKK
jgi:glycosyltransferase involved in cell wall biosynthesis